MLVVKAGRDANAGINESIDRFQAAATELHADVRVVTDPEAAHGFDVGPRTARARAVVKQTLRFLKTRLAPPLPVTESCATKAERASALRFFGADDTTLLGVVVGSGPRGRRAGARLDRASANGCHTRASSRPAGYRVLAYNSRSGNRLDLDIAPAVEALRRTGSPARVVMGSSAGAIAALIGSTSLAVAAGSQSSVSPRPRRSGRCSALEAGGAAVRAGVLRRVGRGR